MTQTENSSIRKPRFVDLPAETLADETVAVRLAGFERGACVTVRSRLRDDAGTVWEAVNEFRADDDGAIDLTKQAPESGTYTGVDQMGFLWSMTPVVATIASPPVLTNVEPKVVTLTAEQNGHTVASAELIRRYTRPGMKRVEVRDDGLFGTLFFPAGSGPHPAIILLSGSGGGLSEPQAALYAARGYAALALAYFRAGHLPDEMIRIPLEYFERAIACLKARPEIDDDRLAVGGASRGGELSLLLGSRFPELKAVVATVPCAIAYGGIGATPAAYLEPAWIHRGEPVPYFDSGRGRVDGFAPEPGVPYSLTPLFLEGLKDEARVQHAEIPVEQINGPVLLISGNEDAMWPSSLYSQKVMSRLAKHRHPYPDQHLAYDGTGHSIGQPWVPTTVSISTHPVANTLYEFGGNAKDSAAARADAWSKTLAFLDARFGRT